MRFEAMFAIGTSTPEVVCADGAWSRWMLSEGCFFQSIRLYYPGVTDHFNESLTKVSELQPQGLFAPSSMYHVNW